MPCALQLLSAFLGIYWPSPPNAVSEFMALVVPTILSLTVLAPYVHALTVGLVLILVLKSNTHSPGFPVPSMRELFAQCRGLLMLLTYVESVHLCCVVLPSAEPSCAWCGSSIAIIAVDFRAFPRYLAKCETYGVSVMDIGVGAFIFGAGSVSRPARGLRSSANHAVKRSGIILALGVIKLLAHSSVEYQVGTRALQCVACFFLFRRLTCSLDRVCMLYVLCCAVLCCAVLCCAVLCCTRNRAEPRVRVWRAVELLLHVRHHYDGSGCAAATDIALRVC